ncbi:MAG TPA: hypothetical protein P5291_03660, partial [Flavobacteriales bacterium]|nr:hypothetical protein [Flavobacteriales bacterium]
MRRKVLALAMLLAGSTQAQDPADTNYRIGFGDTLLFNDRLHYAAFGYDGPAPLFAQLWFPLIEDPATAPLSQAQLRQRTLKGPLRRVYDELLLRMDSAFIAYDLRDPWDGEGPIDYSP